MRGSYLWTIVLVVPALTLPAQGGIFSKKPATKVDPMMRVPQLLFTVKFDQDEKKRVAAAEELREYDSSKFAEIAPLLTDVLQNDKSAAVRTEAAHTLSRIRPVSLTTAQALENASKKDATMRVRMQAWTGLRMIHLAGAYPQLPKDAKPGSDGPMLIPTNQVKDGTPGANPGVVILPYNPAAPLATSGKVNQTVILPYNPSAQGAQPGPLPSAGKVNQAVNIPQPMPSRPGAGFSTAIPSSGQRVNPPMTVEEGPALGPPPLPRN